MAEKQITVTYSLSEENLNLALDLDELGSSILTDYVGDVVAILQEIDESNPQSFDAAIMEADVSREFNRAELKETLRLLFDRSLIEERTPEDGPPHFALNTEK